MTRKELSAEMAHEPGCREGKAAEIRSQAREGKGRGLGACLAVGIQQGGRGAAAEAGRGGWGEREAEVTRGQAACEGQPVPFGFRKWSSPGKLSQWLLKP